MTDPFSSYSIQNWLESCPQGYLADTIYGHGANDREPAAVLEIRALREEAIQTTVLLLAGEHVALAASSGLINAAPDEASKCFLATQTLDEARHVEIFSKRLLDLGVKKDDLQSVIQQYTDPNLVEFASILLERVDKKDFIAGIVGQNLILEGMAFTVFEMMAAIQEVLNPKFTRTLSGTIADERRHIGFGENRIGSLIRRYPERKSGIETMQQEMSYHMLETFTRFFKRSGPAIHALQKISRRLAAKTGTTRKASDWHGANLDHASPGEMKAVLADRVLVEYKTRLARIGLVYRAPESAR